MQIVSLQAENFKRLKAVTITPTGAVVELTGRNKQGKSSTLDAIWAALAGKDAAPPKPVRSGEEFALIKLDLGEIKVTRKFIAQEDGSFTTSLIVESQDGARYPSPQTMLDNLVGSLSFDPLAFTHMEARKQFELLRAFVPNVDFWAIEKANADDFSARTEINRTVKRLEAEAAAIVIDTKAMPVRVDVEALEKTLDEAAAHNADIETRKARRDAAKAAVDNLQADIEDLEARLDAARQAKADLETKLAEAEELPAPIDVADVRAQLADARANNVLAERGERKTALMVQQAEEQAKADALTQAMADRKAAMDKAVAAAKMPVAGLTFGDGAVLLNGEPFEQASDAEQLAASVAIAGALNPSLKVIRVRDGSKLDSDAWTALTAHAEAHGLQVWVETVESGRAAAILIEDGEVAGGVTQTPRSAPKAAAPVAAQEDIV